MSYDRLRAQEPPLRLHRRGRRAALFLTKSYVRIERSTLDIYYRTFFAVPLEGLDAARLSRNSADHLALAP
jgi:hypothetical protein